MESDKMSFSCPACQGVLRIPLELAGVEGPCPNCRSNIAAPIPATQTPPRLLEPTMAAVAPAPIQPFPVPPTPAAPQAPASLAQEPAQPVPTQPAPASQIPPASPPQPPAPSEPVHHPDVSSPETIEWSPQTSAPPQSPPQPSYEHQQATSVQPEASTWPPTTQEPHPQRAQSPALPSSPEILPHANQPGLSGQSLPTNTPQAAQGVVLPSQPNQPTAAPLPGNPSLPNDEISPWNPVPQSTEAPATEQPAALPVTPQATESAPPAAAPLTLGDKPNKRKKRSKPTSVEPKKSKGLPVLFKVAIPLLLLAGIVLGCVKFWPQIQSKLGIGAADKPPATESQNTGNSNAVSKDDPSGFKYTDEPNSKTQAITPTPDAKFDARAEPPPVAPVDPIQLEKIETDPSADATIERAEPVDEDAVITAARDVLEKFLAAKTVDELAPHVLGLKRVRPLMEKYYKDKPPSIKPTFLDHHDSGPLPDSEYFHHAFVLSTTEQPIRFPVGIEETADGPKIDWETFVELHDDMLGKFLASPTSDPQTFHVYLRRAHYFDSDVPSLGSKDCFRISTPITGSEGYAFVEKDSKIAEACKFCEWDLVCSPIATLEWKTPKGGKPYLSIRRIVQKNWRAKNKSDSADRI